jgi:hypothetical protein
MMPPVHQFTLADPIELLRLGIFSLVALSMNLLMTTGPCCSNPMLCHIRRQSMVWFCHHCWQEMPDLTENWTERLRSHRRLSDRLPAVVPA